MKQISSYPFLLTLCILFGPLLMIGSGFLESPLYRWASPIVGALMVIFAFFYVSKKLHEQMEELATLKERLNSLREQP
jgi:hypothetical protein